MFFFSFLPSGRPLQFYLYVYQLLSANKPGSNPLELDSR